MRNVLKDVAKVIYDIEKTVVLSRRARYWRKLVMKNLENEHILTREQINKIQQEYSEYGIKFDPLYHAFYTEKTGVFDALYIPDDLYYCYIDPFYNNWDEAKYFDNKCFYSRLFADIKQPELIASRINHIWVDKNFCPISIKEILKLCSQEIVFVKQATDSEGGHGVTRFEGLNEKEFIDISSSIDSDIVIQKALIQSSTMGKLNSTSVNTIRVLSLLRNGQVNILSTVVRMGVNGAFVDNASSGGITCGVKNDGRLKSIAYSSDGKKFNEHPCTGLKFDTVIIPNFGTITALVQKMHFYIPRFRLISWDIALDQSNEPVLIEANFKYGELDFHQLNNGPLFGEHTKEILDEVFGRKEDQCKSLWGDTVESTL